MNKDKITVNMNIYDIPILVEELEKADKEIERLNNIIDKAIEIIEKYGKEKQLEEDYLMNRVNLANYNCLLLDTLQGDNK